MSRNKRQLSQVAASFHLFWLIKLKEPIRKWFKCVWIRGISISSLKAVATKSSACPGLIRAPQATNFISVEISWLDLVNQRCQYLNWEFLTLSLSVLEQATKREMWFVSPWLWPCRVQGSCDDVMVVLKSTSGCFKVFWFFVALRGNIVVVALLKSKEF